jgi:hypothetical protein
MIDDEFRPISRGLIQWTEFGEFRPIGYAASFPVEQIEAALRYVQDKYGPFMLCAHCSTPQVEIRHICEVAILDWIWLASADRASGDPDSQRLGERMRVVQTNPVTGLESA